MSSRSNPAALMDDPLSSGQVRALRSGRVRSERRAGRTRPARQFRARQPGLVPQPYQATQRSASCSSSTQRLQLKVNPIGYSLSRLQPSAGRRGGSQRALTPGHVEQETSSEGVVPSERHAGRHQAISRLLAGADLGAGGRGFESRHPDQTKHTGRRPTVCRRNDSQDRLTVIWPWS